MVLIILWNDFFFTLFIGIVIDLLFLLLVLVELKLAAWAGGRYIWEWRNFLCRCRCESADTFVILIQILTTRIRHGIVNVLLPLGSRLLILDVHCKLAHFYVVMARGERGFFTRAELALRTKLRLLVVDCSRLSLVCTQELWRFLALLDLIHIVELTLGFFTIKRHVEECVQLFILLGMLLEFEYDLFDFFLKIWQSWIQLT